MYHMVYKRLKNNAWLGIVVLTTVFLTICGISASEGAESLRVEQKEEAYIGCEVVLSLAGSVLDVAGVSYEWTFEGNAKPILLRRGGLECQFTPYDTEPITASVSAVDGSGKFLASSEIVLNAKEFAVEIVMIEPDPFMLWDSKAKQDVPADGLIAGEPIQFTIKLTPEYKGEPHSRWSTDAATAIRDGEAAPKVMIVRNEIGDAELSVVVSDKNKVVLGRGNKNVNVPISRARVEESVRRKKAWGQWVQATTQWDAQEYDASIANAREAAETDPETIEITNGLNTMNARFARVERARNLTADALALHGEQKLADALKSYRRSYAAWELPGTETSIKNLEVEIDRLRVRRQQAEWLRDTGAAYDQEGLFEEALQYYKEMLALLPDEAVQQRTERIERRLDSIAQAKAFADEGRTLEANGQLLTAVEKYKESLKLEASESLANHTKELEETIRERRTRAAALRREAADLLKKNNDAEALLRYRESQALWPDLDLEKRIAELEKTVTTASSQPMRSPEDFGIGTQADAARLLQDGHALYKEGKYRESLDLYRKSHAISKDQRLADWISRVETSLREYDAVQKANILIKDGNNFYNEQKYAEALAKYRESLAIHPNAEVENFMKHIVEVVSSDFVASSEATN